MIGSVAILSEPLSATAVGKLLIVDQETIHLTLRSVLNMPEDQDSPIRLLHPSFRNFLLDKQRCSDQLFWVDEKKAHQVLIRLDLSVLYSIPYKYEFSSIATYVMPLLKSKTRSNTG